MDVVFRQVGFRYCSIADNQKILRVVLLGGFREVVGAGDYDVIIQENDFIVGDFVVPIKKNPTTAIV